MYWKFPIIVLRFRILTLPYGGFEINCYCMTRRRWEIICGTIRWKFKSLSLARGCPTIKDIWELESYSKRMNFQRSKDVYKNSEGTLKPDSCWSSSNQMHHWYDKAVNICRMVKKKGMIGSSLFLNCITWLIYKPRKLLIITLLTIPIFFYLLTFWSFCSVIHFQFKNFLPQII